MRPTYLIALFSLTTTAAFGQTAIDRCTGLLDAELIDRSSVSETRQTIMNEFASFCSQEGSLSEAFEGTSFGFQGAMQRGRNSGSAGLSFDSTSGETEAWFRNVCDQGSSAFSDFLQTDSFITSGAGVTQQYNECVATLVSAGQTFLTGELSETGVLERFTVQFRYEAGSSGPRTVELSGMSGDPIACFGDATDTDPISRENTIEFSGERSITCELPEGQSAAGGTFRFTSPNGPSREVPYSYVARDLVAEMEAQIAADYAARVEAAVPAGQVSMFALEACPAGWRLHEGLAGGRVAVGASEGIGAEVGADTVEIPREALPRQPLRLPTGSTPGDPGTYGTSRNPNAIAVTGQQGNYGSAVRLTDYLGLGEPLELPTPPGIALLPCVRQ
ncbi:hypothetical protein [Gymnodinialimonas hymeniacidonis]|uniref:hypothetical protein n=1 Tax=Gymnodinialimonas hymeniacidonis TaxID=3126508 RepID=UPI0034C5D72D